jgi:hypothetical protein
MPRLTFVKIGIVVLSLLTLAVRQSIAQEVVAIRGGTFSVEVDPVTLAEQNSLEIFGTSGFKLEGSVSLASNEFNGVALCKFPECPPGTVIPVNDAWSGGDMFVTARLQGVTYTAVGGPGDDASAEIGFSASVTLPPMSDGPVTISVPFDSAGHFAFGLNGPDPRRVLLAGGGEATFTLVPLAESAGQTWLIQRVVFDFRPVEAR